MESTQDSIADFCDPPPVATPAAEYKPFDMRPSPPPQEEQEEDLPSCLAQPLESIESAMSPQEKRLQTIRRNAAARKAAIAAAKESLAKPAKQEVPQPQEHHDGAKPVHELPKAPLPDTPSVSHDRVPNRVQRGRDEVDNAHDFQPIHHAAKQTDDEFYRSKYYNLKQEMKLKDMMRSVAAETAKSAVSEFLEKMPVRQPPPPPQPIRIDDALTSAHADLKARLAAETQRDFLATFSKFTR